MIAKEISSLPCEIYSGIKYYLEKITAYIIFNMITGEISSLPSEKILERNSFQKKSVGM